MSDPHPSRCQNAKTSLYLHENNNVSVSALPWATTDETDFRGHVAVVSKFGCSPDVVFN